MRIARKQSPDDNNESVPNKLTITEQNRYKCNFGYNGIDITINGKEAELNLLLKLIKEYYGVT